MEETEDITLTIDGQNCIILWRILNSGRKVDYSSEPAPYVVPDAEADLVIDETTYSDLTS